MCGYDKCPGALHFHHVDPTEKDLGISDMRGSIRGWATIIIELRKCILLCSNCHAEVHAGITTIPTDYCKFNEQYINYKQFEHSAPQ